MKLANLNLSRVRGLSKPCQFKSQNNAFKGCGKHCVPSRNVLRFASEQPKQAGNDESIPSRPSGGALRSADYENEGVESINPAILRPSGGAARNEAVNIENQSGGLSSTFLGSSGEATSSSNTSLSGSGNASDEESSFLLSVSRPGGRGGRLDVLSLDDDLSMGANSGSKSQEENALNASRPGGYSLRGGEAVASGGSGPDLPNSGDGGKGKDDSEKGVSGDDGGKEFGPKTGLYFAIYVAVCGLCYWTHNKYIAKPKVGKRKCCNCKH